MSETPETPEDNTTEETEARVRVRSRIPNNTSSGTIGATRSAPAAAPSSDGADWMKTGSEARKVSEKEQAKQEERERRRAEGIFMPFRFWLPAGKQTELVILDEAPGPCFHEHHLQDPNTGKWDIYEGCPKDFESCPLCDGVAGGKESYYVMMLSVVVLDPYINKHGVTVPHSRKLLAVKTHDQAFFYRQAERNGGLRGVHLLMARQSKQDSNIGRPEFITKHSEAEIIKSFGHPKVTASDGRVIKAENADCYPFEYAKLWTKPSGDDLRRRYGGAPPMGSKADIEGASTITSGSRPAATADDEPLDDDIPF